MKGIPKPIKKKSITANQNVTRRVNRRINDLLTVEVTYNFAEKGFIGKFEYNRDFNVSDTEIMTSTDQEWKAIIEGLRTELEKRKEQFNG